MPERIAATVTEVLAAAGDRLIILYYNNGTNRRKPRCFVGGCTFPTAVTKASSCFDDKVLCCLPAYVALVVPYFFFFLMKRTELFVSALLGGGLVSFPFPSTRPLQSVSTLLSYSF